MSIFSGLAFADVIFATHINAMRAQHTHARARRTKHTLRVRATSLECNAINHTHNAQTGKATSKQMKVDAKDFVSMAFVSGKHGDADARTDVPKAKRLVFASG